MVTKLIGIREFRQHIATLHKKAQRNQWRFVVLSRNKPIFKVEPINEEDATLEQLAFDVAQAREDVKKGRVYTTKEVRRELGL